MGFRQHVIILNSNIIRAQEFKKMFYLASHGDVIGKKGFFMAVILVLAQLHLQEYCQKNGEDDDTKAAEELLRVLFHK